MLTLSVLPISRLLTPEIVLERRSRKMNKLIKACFLFLGLFVAANFANAQSSGTVTGTVTDSTGAIVPNATITAHNSATGVDTIRTSNGSGLYVLVLQAGTYRIEGSAAGFQ